MSITAYLALTAAGIIASSVLWMQAFMVTSFLLWLASLFSVIWLMPRRMVAATAALATALIILLKGVI